MFLTVFSESAEATFKDGYTFGRPGFQKSKGKYMVPKMYSGDSISGGDRRGP